MESYPNDNFKRSRECLEGVIAKLCGPRTVALDQESVGDLIEVEGREILRLLLQDHLDLRTALEHVKPMVGADEERRTEFRTSHRALDSRFGPVTVTRLAISRHGVPGALRPLDARLNLPPRKHSRGVIRQIAWGVAQSSYDITVADVRRTTGLKIGKKQAEDLAIHASVDFESFYLDRAVQPVGSGELVVLTFDGKGVVMLPSGLREGTRKRAEAAAPPKPSSPLAKKKGKNRKRMAEVASVYSLKVVPRSPDDVMRELRKDGPYVPRPKATSKRVWATLKHPIPTAVDLAFYEALGRDEEQEAPWVVLVDGNQQQLDAIESSAVNYGVTVTVVIDFIHVLEYLWRAGRALLGKADKEALQEWVSTRARRLLEGKVSNVAAGIRRSATLRKIPKKRREKLDRAVDYLLSHKQYLRYDEYLAAGFPIASGVIEGACRSLVRDRMDITGARWGLSGAEAVLKLRALRQSGDFDEYWSYHGRQELERNHLIRYAEPELSDIRYAS